MANTKKVVPVKLFFSEPKPSMKRETSKGCQNTGEAASPCMAIGFIDIILTPDALVFRSGAGVGACGQFTGGVQ
jgi:hypothetical protein